jgi:hypothetical protein
VNKVACKNGLHSIIACCVELATMAFVTVMAVVSTMRLLGIVS